MYVINHYQLFEISSHLYLSTQQKGAKISNQALAHILTRLKRQEKLEITEEQLIEVAREYQVDHEQLKQILINQLQIIKPMVARKIPLIYLDTDDEFISNILQQTLETEYHIQVVTEKDKKFSPRSLIVFYRQNYSSDDFSQLYHQLDEENYVITAGILHHLLIIDNIYFKNSGLPTHFSNLHQLITYLKSDIPATKNNWLLFYRHMLKDEIDQFPTAAINVCQQGYIAYCLFQFVSQFTNLWRSATPLDQLNWFWHIDLTNFNVHKEVAIHSPFSEFDMNLNLTNKMASGI